MKHLRLLAIASFLFAGVAAHADTLKTFNLSGKEDSGKGTLSGTITIDITKGFVVSDSFKAGTTAESGVYRGTQAKSAYSFLTNADDVFKIAVGSLVNFTGGSFSLDMGCDGYSGYITPQANPLPTPEPSSMALLGTGVLGVAGVVRRRFNAARQA